MILRKKTKNFEIFEILSKWAKRFVVHRWHLNDNRSVSQTSLTFQNSTRYSLAWKSTDRNRPGSAKFEKFRTGPGPGPTRTKNFEKSRTDLNHDTVHFRKPGIGPGLNWTEILCVGMLNTWRNWFNTRGWMYLPTQTKYSFVRGQWSFIRESWFQKS